MDGLFGSHRDVPDYAAFARQLEACSRLLAERAATTGDHSQDAAALQLRYCAAEIRAGLHRLAEQPVRPPLGLFDFQPRAVGADDADPRSGGQVRPLDAP